MPAALCEDTLLIPVEEVSVLACEAMALAGTPEENATTQIDHWLEAELRGHKSHGLLRLPRIIERIHNKVADPCTTGSLSWRAPAFLEVDGEMGLGPVIAQRALEEISAKAKECGIAIAGIRNSNHLGMLAPYAEQIAKKAQVLIALTNSEALVHPWGGSEAMLGTNPIAIGVPTESEPLVVDMATSIVSMGKIHDYADRGQALENGWAVDAAGNPTTDAAAAKDGAIGPFGGAKGYALGVAFEAIVACLANSDAGPSVAGTLDSTEVCNKGDVFIVIEPAGNAPLGMLADYLNSLRDSRTLGDNERVLVPGDRARTNQAYNREYGIPMTADSWRILNELAGQTVCKYV